MLSIAGQTAVPNGLTLWRLMGGRGCQRLKKILRAFDVVTKKIVILVTY